MRVVGTDRSITLSEVAAASDEPLAAIGEFVQDEATYPNGTHICEVEIDPQTGVTENCPTTRWLMISEPR